MKKKEFEREMTKKKINNVPLLKISKKKREHKRGSVFAKLMKVAKGQYHAGDLQGIRPASLQTSLPEQSGSLPLFLFLLSMFQLVNYLFAIYDVHPMTYHVDFSSCQIVYCFRLWSVLRDVCYLCWYISEVCKLEVINFEESI